MPSETVQRLREQLREKFPAAHRGAAGLASRPEPPGDETPESAGSFEWHPSNFPSGAITEISPAHPACGLTLLIAALLENPESGNPATLVLIDARDRFDPASFSPGACSRLLWLRCRETLQAFQAADLLLRDGNLPFILLDLSALPARELRRIPAASWHRLRQLAESGDGSLLVLTPAPLVPGAALRLTLTRELTLHHLDLSRADLLPLLQAETTRRHARTA